MKGKWITNMLHHIQGIIAEIFHCENFDLLVVQQEKVSETPSLKIGINPQGTMNVHLH